MDVRIFDHVVNDRPGHESCDLAGPARSKNCQMPQCRPIAVEVLDSPEAGIRDGQIAQGYVVGTNKSQNMRRAELLRRQPKEDRRFTVAMQPTFSVAPVSGWPCEPAVACARTVSLLETTSLRRTLLHVLERTMYLEYAPSMVPLSPAIVMLLALVAEINGRSCCSRPIGGMKRLHSVIAPLVRANQC